MSQFCLFVFVLQPDSFWIKLNTQALALVSKPTCHNYDSSQFCLFLHLRLTALVQNQRHTQYSSDVCLFFRLGLRVTVIVQKRHSGFSSLQTSQHVKTRQISVRCFVILLLTVWVEKGHTGFRTNKPTRHSFTNDTSYYYSPGLYISSPVVAIFLVAAWATTTNPSLDQTDRFTNTVLREMFDLGNTAHAALIKRKFFSPSPFCEHLLFWSCVKNQRTRRHKTNQQKPSLDWITWSWNTWCVYTDLENHKDTAGMCHNVTC